MRLGTIFSGIGAPEQAAMRVWGEACELVFACEWDKFARQSFKANYAIADEHFHTDISDMDGTKYLGKVDIIIGGSPCQDFSLAGLRQGLNGKRGQLIWQYFRIIQEVMPPVFIWENVKGFISDKKGKTLKDFLEVFRSIGYNCHYGVVDTQDYGVPQRRERIYIVGFLDVDAYYRFSFAPKVPLTKRLKDVLETNVDEKYYLSQKIIQGFKTHKERHSERGNGFKFSPKTSDETASCLSTKYGGRPTDTYIKIVGKLDIKGNDCIKRVYGVDGIAPTLSTMQGGNQEVKIRQKSQSGVRFRNECGTLSASGNRADMTVVEPKIVAMRGRNPDNPTSRKSGLPTVQRLEENTQGVSNTITTVQKDNLVQEQEFLLRKLTPRECLRLQNFPDTFKQVVSDSQMYKQAGNAMSVNVVEMIFKQIDRAFKNIKSNTKQKSLFCA